MIKDLYVVSIAVANLEEAVPRWEKLLNVKGEPIRTLGTTGARWCTLPFPGGGSFELIEAKDPQHAVNRFLAANGEGIFHVALEVDDVDAELARVAGAGAKLVDRKARPATLGNGKLAFVRAGTGNKVLIELFEKY